MTWAEKAGATGLVAIAVIHLLDLPGKLTETPYVGFMYIALIVAAIATAALLVSRLRARLAWSGTAILAASTFIGYVLSRTTGLPRARGDIGNWFEPLGLASLVIEAGVVLLATTQFRSRAQEPHFEYAIRQESKA